MNSTFTGSLTITNNKSAQTTKNSVTVVLSFQSSSAPDQLTVTVPAFPPETFPITGLPFGLKDSVTATPEAAAGTYDLVGGQIALTLPIKLTDTDNILSETVQFPLSTSGYLTPASAGSSASGQPMNAQGTITLVGSANVTASIETVGVGLVLAGALSPPPARVP